MLTDLLLLFIYRRHLIRMEPDGFSVFGVAPRGPHEESLHSSEWFPSLANLAGAKFAHTLIQAVDVRKDEPDLKEKEEWKQLKTFIREVHNLILVLQFEMIISDDTVLSSSQTLL